MDRLGEQLNQSGGGTKAHKLKIFISKTLAGLEGLRTREHLKWWQSNTVPTAGLKYYSIGATMTDPRRSNLDRSMVENSPNLQITSNDFKIGLKSYRSMMLEPSASSFNYDQVTSLHDGNVPLQRAMFWPKLLASLNPANQLETEFLGIVGVNHFALAHAHGSGDTFQNPFPRTALLKSIAAKVSFDSQKK